MVTSRDGPGFLINLPSSLAIMSTKIDDILKNVNWLAMIAGTVLAFVPGIFWFGQILARPGPPAAITPKSPKKCRFWA